VNPAARHASILVAMSSRSPSIDSDDARRMLAGSRPSRSASSVSSCDFGVSDSGVPNACHTSA
jgi:hypothetical protein